MQLRCDSCARSYEGSWYAAAALWAAAVPGGAQGDEVYMCMPCFEDRLDAAGVRWEKVRSIRWDGKPDRGCWNYIVP